MGVRAERQYKIHTEEGGPRVKELGWQREGDRVCVSLCVFVNVEKKRRGRKETNTSKTEYQLIPIEIFIPKTIYTKNIEHHTFHIHSVYTKIACVYAQPITHIRVGK